MNSSLRLAQIYFGIGFTYGLGRTYYWTNHLNESTYTVNGKVEHPITTSTKLYYYFITTQSSLFCWPFFALTDYSYYEKNKLGIKELIPPMPYGSLKWK